jgi:microcystin-dependent protein
MPVLMIEIQADGTGGTWTNYLTPNESDIVIFSSQASTIGEYLFDILDPIGVPKPFFGSESYVPDRHLVCSGGTIGNALSGATARANDDTWRLFDLLWNSFSDAELPIVPPGRGVSSSADFGANKSLPIPDLRGRTLVGKDDMGGVAASRMTSGGNRIAGNTLGAVGGEQQHTLAEGEMPIHNHSVAATVNSISSEKVDVHNEQSGTDPIVSIRTGTVGNDTNVEVTRADSGGSFYGSGMYCTVPAHGHTVTVSQNDKGSGSAHDNVQPGIIVNYIVRYK